MSNESTELKICLHCKHRKVSDMRFPICMRVASLKTDIVTGDQEWVGQTKCCDERRVRIFRAGAYCGPDGRFFEPKEKE